jgi:CBS domain-containing protein
MDGLNANNILVGTQPAVWTLQTSQTVGDALDMFAKHNISGAPLLDDTTAVSFIDVVDIVCFLMEKLREPKESRITPTSTSLDTDDLSIMFARADEFKGEPLAKVGDMSKRNLYVSVPSDAPLSRVITHFRKGVHRVALLDQSRNVENVVSQSDLLRWLSEDPKRIPPMKGIHEAGNMNWMHAVTAEDQVSSVTPAFRAFESVQKSSKGAVAVVDDEGAIVGCLSASDLKKISPILSNLLQPVADFLAPVRKGQERSPDWVITANTNTTMKDLVNTMTREKVHRVFVVEASGKPKSIVSLTDIVRELFD